MKEWLYIYKCGDCGEFFSARLRRHYMYYCTDCKQSGVDIEEYYSRMIGNPIFIKKIRIDV